VANQQLCKESVWRSGGIALIIL